MDSVTYSFIYDILLGYIIILRLGWPRSFSNGSWGSSGRSLSSPLPPTHPLAMYIIRNDPLSNFFALSKIHVWHPTGDDQYLCLASTAASGNILLVYFVSIFVSINSYSKENVLGIATLHLNANPSDSADVECCTLWTICRIASS